MKSNQRISSTIKTADMDACGVSDPGLERSENEDSIYLCQEGNFVLLADGMGGHERGAEASRTAIEVIKKYFSPEVMSEELLDITEGSGIPAEIACLESLVDSSVTSANEEVYGLNQKIGARLFMGTTVVGLLMVQGGYALWFHVGDSRIYRWRDNELTGLTSDHSAYMEWKRKGKIGPAPKKNIITRAIGPNPAVTPDIKWDERQTGDIFILCSDGLTDMITVDQISEILSAGNEVDKIANLLVEAANLAGGKDNVSAVVCRVV
jgi:PPM family protein phosphatase